ncbi:hypothetical protein E8E14_003750 [Neopestalotiopsis sp. 37M]|nr:hypothetical protein E8E14_003750 [Neopestalotiopsis sp. 37M]
MWTLSGFALGAVSVIVSQLPSGVSATSYTNPILPGWHTDPSCVFAPEWDNTTFCTTSSFLAFPGIPIYASKDLTHWRLASNALNRDSQVPELLTDLNDPDYGILAGTLRIHDGVFYLITVWANTAHELGYFYVFQTTDPYDDAAWSEPLYVPAPGGLRTIDPDIFWDDASGQVVMAFAGSPIGAVYLDLATGNTSDVFDLWQSSAGDFAEGPHLYKRDGYYYLLIAQGGTQIGHKAMLARATSLNGPWEEYPANPWLTNSGTDEYFQTVGHADIFQDAEGNWWGVALSTRGGPDLYNASVYPMGRETVLYPVVWQEGEWPVPQQVRGSMDGPLPAQDPDPPGEGDLVDAPDSVDFTPGSSLPKHWVYWRAPAKPEDFTVSPPEQPGTLRLTASRANLTGDAAFQPLDGLTLIARLQTATYFSFSVDLALGFAQGSGDEAGVSSFLNNDQHVDLGVVYLPGSSSCGALRPHLRFRATALGKENITIPEDVITPLPLSWGGGNVRLALATKNETHFEFTAALASSPENILNVATFKTDLVSGGGAASGGLMGIYATTNGGNRTVATNAYFSQWRYNSIAQEIDYNVLVGSYD